MIADAIQRHPITMKSKLWISAIAVPFLLLACENKTETEQRVEKVQEELNTAVDNAVESGNLTEDEKKQLEAAQKEMENLTDEQKKQIAEAHKTIENLTPEQKKQLEEAQKQAAEALKNAGGDIEAAQKAIKEAQEKAAAGGQQ